MMSFYLSLSSLLSMMMTTMRMTTFSSPLFFTMAYHHCGFVPTTTSTSNSRRPYHARPSTTTTMAFRVTTPPPPPRTQSCRNLALCATNKKNDSDAEQHHQHHHQDEFSGGSINNDTNNDDDDDHMEEKAEFGINNINEVRVDEEEEEDTNDIQYQMSKISWLPNVKLGKQPYKSTTASAVSSLSSFYKTSSSSKNNMNHKIEILPVLPMTMVCGLGGDILSMDTVEDSNIDDENEEEEEDPTTDLFEEKRRRRQGRGAAASSSSTMVWNSCSDDDTLLGFRGIGGADSLSSQQQHPLSQIILGPPFSNGGTSSYLPHTKNHILTISEPRYKHMYDDLLRLGNYAGARREGMMRRAAMEEERRMLENEDEEGTKKKRLGISSSGSLPSSIHTSTFPNPDEKRRFIVTAANPIEDGVFAEYGLLFQLKDLDEISALGGVVGEEGDGDGGGLTMEELEDLVGSYHDADEEEDEEDYGDFVDIGDDDDDEEDVMDILLRTHYEATHDVVGRVRIHRFVNPECFTEDPPGGEEYLMAEATILDVIEEVKGVSDDGEVKSMRERKLRAAATRGTNGRPSKTTTSSTPTSNTLKLEEELAKAVARIKEELRSSVNEAFKEQQQSDNAKDEFRALGIDDLSPPTSKNRKGSNSNKNNPLRKAGDSSSSGNVERFHKDPLTKEEFQLREAFAKLVALQHELKEECRFTRVSVQTFGVGPVGVWLSAAAWSQFVEKRLEATYDDMQCDLQSNLVEYLAERDNDSGGVEHEGNIESVTSLVEEAETIDFEDLSPQLQQEFQFIQARATEELGPLALERAIQMQRIVQAESYAERLDLLRECVDNERRRLEVKKMLKSLALKVDRKGENSMFNPGARREKARSLFERLISSTDVNRDQVKDQENGSFQ